ncbi:PREDICTED: uncharacterized protein LOC105151464 [Acromyrmex echinatior]|uniref:uncharacterized protein LOC105151464 n=1 Tax=Acromyrmex echinatior TaxID=103372 RepID=UPI000581077B|nr:PREDICTED: uncharacterized protein LOC105151464 [Acromyrmex echinatior]
MDTSCRFVASRVSGVPFKLSDSSHSPRAIIVYYRECVRECPVREDDNHVLRGGGGLGETSGTIGATLRRIIVVTDITPLLRIRSLIKIYCIIRSYKYYISVDTVSDNTSINNKIDDFCENPIEDVLTQKFMNFMNLLKHTENLLSLLNKRIRTTRTRVQVELKEQIESLSEEKVNEVLQSLDIDSCVRKLVEAEHNIAMSSHILQNTEKCLNKIYQDVLSMTKQKYFYILILYITAQVLKRIKKKAKVKLDKHSTNFLY